MIYRNETQRAMSAKKEDSNILGNDRGERERERKERRCGFVVFYVGTNGYESLRKKQKYNGRHGSEWLYSREREEEEGKERRASTWK
jgi:hypothetical protein